MSILKAIDLYIDYFQVDSIRANPGRVAQTSEWHVMTTQWLLQG